VSQPAPDHQQERQESRQASQRSSHEENLRRVFNWVVVIATILFAIFGAAFLAHQALQPDSWLVQLWREHLAAVVGVPLAAVMAMCVVILLRFGTGPIKFEGLGFKFRGAAGEVVFWIFCFLAIIAALRLLWGLES
jgi:hypothetical protein